MSFWLLIIYTEMEIDIYLGVFPHYFQKWVGFDAKLFNDIITTSKDERRYSKKKKNAASKNTENIPDSIDYKEDSRCYTHSFLL